MRIQQVILNLLANAIKFTQKGSVTIKARDYEQDDKDYIEIDIIDTGVGIKESDQSKLFRLFGFTSSIKKDNTHGIGLGTTLAKNIIDQYDGSLSV